MMLISLCMIVKNEQFFLPSMLQTLRPFVEEIVIVDTGSTDNTIEVSRKFTDRLITLDEFPGFSEARNLAINNARGDWILSLDADEIILPEDMLKLRRIARTAPFDDGFFISRTHYTGNGRWSLTWGIKFFKRIESIRYCKNIHESVGEAITDWQEPFGRRLPWITDVQIHHFEIWKTKEQLISKHYHYIDLLEKEIQERPFDAHIYAFLALEHFAVFGVNTAIETSDRAINALIKDGGNPSGLPLLFRALFNLKKHNVIDAQADLEKIMSDGRSYTFKAAAALANIQYKNSNFEAAIELLNYALNQIGRDPAILCNLAICNESLGRYEEALLLYREVLLISPYLSDSRIYSSPSNESVYSMQEDLFTNYKGVWYHIVDCLQFLGHVDLEKKARKRIELILNSSNHSIDFIHGEPNTSYSEFSIFTK
ncbi:glycosyltransferase [Cohnella sp. LGH]|uniref:tetratricopeptide repeat-containing glycosyltransferase family 2 protein n=1 Tax=Cohnella sp. LGH TaxID=1619153 RepID=UPI001ADACA5F|nr:glycosyltransferase [Cohnella sp. LGH]QTH41194.1 glycosyltransferase [Cohnella sp. LGH]